MEGKNLNSGHSLFTNQHFGFDCGIQPLWEVSPSANGRGCQGCGVGLGELPGFSLSLSVVLGQSAAEMDGNRRALPLC